jgi:hypothetical protein
MIVQFVAGLEGLVRVRSPARDESGLNSPSRSFRLQTRRGQLRQRRRERISTLCSAQTPAWTRRLRCRGHMLQKAFDRVAISVIGAALVALAMEREPYLKFNFHLPLVVKVEAHHIADADTQWRSESCQKTVTYRSLRS